MPLPLGSRRTAVDLGGVPAERVVARGADGPQQVLYLHGGGYKTGSPTSHRALTAHLSRACGAPVHVPHYRLAPEHPSPRSPWVTTNARRDAMLDARTLAPAAAQYRAGAGAPELEPLAADFPGF